MWLGTWCAQKSWVLILALKKGERKKMREGGGNKEGEKNGGKNRRERRKEGEEIRWGNGEKDGKKTEQ